MDIKKAIITTVLAAGIIIPGLIGSAFALKAIDCLGKDVQFDYASKYYCAHARDYDMLKEELTAEYNREKTTPEGNPFDFDINYMQLLYGVMAHEARTHGLTGEISDKKLLELYILTK